MIRFIRRLFCKHEKIYQYETNRVVQLCRKCGKVFEEDGPIERPYIPCRFWVHAYGQCLRGEWAVNVQCQGDKNSCEYPRPEQERYAL